MEKHDYSKSALAKQIENLLADNSLFSDSNPSHNNTRSTSAHNKSKKDIRDVEGDNISKRNNKVKKTKKRKSEKSRSNSRQKKGKSLVRAKSPLTRPPDHVSKLKDNYSLRMKMHEMKKLLETKEKKIQRLYDNIYDEREEVKALASQANSSKKKDILIQQLSDRVKKLQENEKNLMKELSDQQKVAKDALNKLYELQEESVT